MWQIMVFFLGALILAGFSVRFFSNPRSHGFFRFLSFAALWAVFVGSLPSWFHDVLSTRHIVSWILLASALALAIGGYAFLLSAGRPPVRRPAGDPAAGPTPGLATKGPYRYIRHPLYASLILLGWGMAFQSGSFAGIFFAVLSTGLLYLTALTEELQNLERFGETYEKYMTETRMFVPGVF